MKKLSIVAILVLLMCSSINAQDNREGCYLIGSSIFTIGTGIIVHDLMQQSASDKLSNRNNSAMTTFQMSANQKSYDATMKNARYVRTGCALFGIVLGIAGACDLLQPDGTVKVASIGGKNLSVGSNGSNVGLCYRF